MSDYDITTDERGCIRNGLRADIMRCCMENKNLLSQKGSIYVGTGEKIIIGSGENAIRIARTEALLPGSNEGELLMVKNGELCYSKLSEENFSYDDTGDVEGAVGDLSHPVEEICYYTNPSLYSMSDSISLSSGVCNITFNNGFKMLHMSIKTNVAVGGNEEMIDFGFLYRDPNINQANFEAVMFPVNKGDSYSHCLLTPTVSENFIYLVITTNSISGSAVSIHLSVKGPGVNAAIQSGKLFCSFLQ